MVHRVNLHHPTMVFMAWVISRVMAADSDTSRAVPQGLALVHFSAQRKHLLMDAVGNSEVQ